MARQQDDWGAAEPIRQVGVRAYNAAKSYLSRVPSGRKDPPRDTSTHDRLVREANESFRKSSARTTTTRTPAKRKSASRSAARRSSR